MAKKIISQTPTRIPLKDLYAEFNNLKKESDQYRVLCKRNGIPVTLGFNNFHEWQKCLADPPVIDDATFYVENLSLKRKAADEKFTASKQSEHRPTTEHMTFRGATMRYLRVPLWIIYSRAML